METDNAKIKPCSEQNIITVIEHIKQHAENNIIDILRNYNYELNNEINRKLYMDKSLYKLCNEILFRCTANNSNNIEKLIGLLSKIFISYIIAYKDDIE